MFALHEVVLPPDVTPDEYEQLFGNQVGSSTSLPGWKTYLLKGDRGEGSGKASHTVRGREADARSVFSQT